MGMKKVSLYECTCCSSVLSSDKKEVLAKMGGICPFCNGKGRMRAFIDIHPKRIFDSISNARNDYRAEAVFIDCNGISNPRIGVRFIDDYFNPQNNAVEIPKGFTKIRTRVNRLPYDPVELVHYFDVPATECDYTLGTAVSDVLRDLDSWVKTTLL